MWSARIGALVELRSFLLQQHETARAAFQELYHDVASDHRGYLAARDESSGPLHDRQRGRCGIFGGRVIVEDVDASRSVTESCSLDVRELDGEEFVRLLVLITHDG
jgi:hypothetical protein